MLAQNRRRSGRVQADYTDYFTLKSSPPSHGEQRNLKNLRELGGSVIFALKSPLFLPAPTAGTRAESVDKI
jgi:hypothetical protein